MSATRKSVIEEGPFQLEVIECTRQPGSLRISKRACAMRYRLAQKDDLKIPNDEFGMARRSGLDICRKCPSGKHFFKALSHELEQEEPRRRVTIPFPRKTYDTFLEEMS